MRTFVVSRSGQFFEEPVFTVGSVFCVVYLKHLVKLVVWSSRAYIGKYQAGLGVLFFGARYLLRVSFFLLCFLDASDVFMSISRS